VGVETGAALVERLEDGVMVREVFKTTGKLAGGATMAGISMPAVVVLGADGGQKVDVLVTSAAGAMVLPGQFSTSGPQEMI
jgi:hypothetical protein